jgi:[acyl-carrier-protein] S-malonyltransferase
MARSIALLFSGQGAQQIGMGKDLSERFPAAASRFALADKYLGRSVSQIAFEGPIEDLTKTSNCQVALYVHGIAVLDALRMELPQLTFAACAGLSLGEFTAHAAAGTFDFETGLDLVAKRSAFMEESCNETEGTMAAFVGGAESDVRAIAEQTDVDVANLNAPGQIVLSGSKPNIQAAIDLAKSRGIRRALPLTVAGAFHSRLMASAEQRLRAELARATLRAPQTAVVANVTARPVKSEDAVRETLATQVTASVRWSESVQFMIQQLGINLFLELGPGAVLAGLVSRITNEAEVISIGSVAALESALERLQ